MRATVAPALSPATEIRLIAARELRRSVRSVKGIILGIITLLGAFVDVPRRASGSRAATATTRRRLERGASSR